MQALTEGRLEFLDSVEHNFANIEDVLHMETDTWNANDASFSDYGVMAARCGLFRVGLTTRIRLDRLSDNVALDIAGGTNGAALQELMHERRIDTGIVTNLLDKRSDQTRANSKLLHVDGDLIERETWQNMFSTVFEATNGVGLSLIMHRPCGTLQDFAPAVYAGSFALLLDWLRPGGVMFAQVPAALRDSPASLQDICQRIHERDDIEEVKTSKYIGFNYSALVIKAAQDTAQLPSTSRSHE